MLRISKLSDYAMVIMSYLALKPDNISSAAQVAQQTKLTLPTVSKILKLLAEMELVIAARGVNGGYRLAYPARQITITAVLSAIEGEPAMTECCASDDVCEHDASCSIKDNWKVINKVILQALSGLTIQDLIRPLSQNVLALKGIPIVTV